MTAPVRGNVFTDLTNVAAGIAEGSATRRREREEAAREAALQSDRVANTAIRDRLAELQEEQLTLMREQGVRDESFRRDQLKQGLTLGREQIAGREKVAGLNANKPTSFQASMDLNEAQGEIRRLVAGFDLPGETTRLQGEARQGQQQYIQEREQALQRSQQEAIDQAPAPAPQPGTNLTGASSAGRTPQAPESVSPFAYATPEQIASISGISIPSETEIRLDYIDQLVESLQEKYKGRLTPGALQGLVMDAVEERFGALGTSGTPQINMGEAQNIVNRVAPASQPPLRP